MASIYIIIILQKIRFFSLFFTFKIYIIEPIDYVLRYVSISFYSNWIKNFMRYLIKKYKHNSHCSKFYLIKFANNYFSLNNINIPVNKVFFFIITYQISIMIATWIKSKIQNMHWLQNSVVFFFFFFWKLIKKLTDKMSIYGYRTCSCYQM